ncbi:hypothetical protein ACWIGI_39545 [Nocardia sp. NPDC055321]
MMTQKRLAPTALAAIFIAAAFPTVAGCSSGIENDNGAPAPTTAATVASFPYPGLQFRWDIAVPLDEAETAAARFVLETEVLESRMLIGEYDSLLPQVLPRVSYDNRPFPPSSPPLPETGGTLTRAVAVDDLGGNHWVVTYCDYDTPGAYSRGADGALELSTPERRYSARQSNVALTQEKSGTGETADTPRLLVVSANHNGSPRPRPQPNDDETCLPFMPEPFVQQPPSPVPGK